MSLQIRSLHGPAQPGLMLNSSPSPSSSTPGCCGLCSAPSQAMQNFFLGEGVTFPWALHNHPEGCSGSSSPKSNWFEPIFGCV